MPDPKPPEQPVSESTVPAPKIVTRPQLPKFGERPGMPKRPFIKDFFRPSNMTGSLKVSNINLEMTEETTVGSDGSSKTVRKLTGSMDIQFSAKKERQTDAPSGK